VARQTQFPKKNLLALLRRSGVTEKTVNEIAEHLPELVDLDRDGKLLLQYGITRDRLVSRMGGSP
jgi:hypothetical protein